MESEIVIQHLEVRYADFENMGIGRKNVEHFRDFHGGKKGESLIFKKKSIFSKL